MGQEHLQEQQNPMAQEPILKWLKPQGESPPSAWRRMCGSSDQLQPKGVKDTEMVEALLGILVWQTHWTQIPGRGRTTNEQVLQMHEDMQKMQDMLADVLFFFQFQDLLLMESEKIEGRDPFFSATHVFNETSDATPSQRCSGGTELTTTSNISEEQVAEKKGETNFSQELSFCFVVGEQIQGKFSNSFVKETSGGLERGQKDPENWTGLSERERVLTIQEDNLEDSRDPSLNCRQGELTITCSSSTHQALLSNTLTQISSIPSEAVLGQVETHAFIGFPQTLDSNDTLSQMPCEETENFPVSKCHQNADPFKARSDEDHSSEAQYERDNDALKDMEAMWGMDATSSKTEESDQIDPSPSRKCEEEKARELVIQREDVKSCIPFQKDCGCSEDRRINVEDMNKKELRQNSYTTLHLQVDEEDGTEGSYTHPLKEGTQTKHVKSSEEEEEKEENHLDRKKTEHKIKIKDKLKLKYSDAQEEQEWGMQVRKTSSRGRQRDEMATSQDMLDPDTVYNWKNNFALPDLNQSNSLSEAEGFIFSFKVFSPGHYSESHVQNKAFATKPTVQYPVNASSSTQSQICNEFREFKSSSIYDQTVYKQITEGNRNLSLEKEASENVGDEKSIWNIDSERMAISCRDLFVMANSQDLHNSKPRDCAVDVELDISTSPLGIITVADPLQKGAGKEVSDATIDNAVLCEVSNSVEERASKKLPVSWQVGLMACEDASAVQSDTFVQAASKNGTCNKDFHKYSQGSASKICQSVSPEESLSNTTKENVEFTLVTPLTTWDLLSIQEEGSTITYLEEFRQPIESPMKRSEFQGKEATADTFFIKEQVSINESPYLSVPEEDKTENDHNTDIPAFPTTDFRIGIDVKQLKEPLVPVPVSDQCLLNEPATSHFSHLSSSPPSCSQPIQLLTPPDNINAPAQLKARVLHPSCLSHFLEQLPPCSQSCPFLVVKSTDIKEEKPRSDTDVFDQSPNSQCELNQYVQPPDSVPSSDQYDNNQPTSMSIILQKPTTHCAFPEHMGSQSILQDDFIQITDCTAPGHNNNLTEDPFFATNRGSYKPPPPFSLSRLPTPGGNQFVQQPVEVLESNLPSNCTEGDGMIHTGVPISKFVSQTIQSENIAQIQYMNSIVEESSIVQLPKLEGGNAPQGQKDWNIFETSSDLGVNMLDTDSVMEILGNYTSSVDSIAETMSQVMDMHDAKSSFDCTSHSSLDSQKKCEATEYKNSRQPPPVLAFTNPIHFFQLEPPSPPTRHPSSSQADYQGPQWQQEQTGYAKIPTSAVTRQLAEDTRRFRKNLEKSGMEPIHAVVQKTDRVAKHPLLEKSSSCPDKNFIALDPKESNPNLKKQEVLIKHRAKSKDWHRHGVRKISVPTDSELEIIASLVPSKEDAHVHKDKTDHLDQAKSGEKKPGGTIENIKRRHSKLINSSKVLYQEYSDVALNKAIQSQKRADSLTEDVELVSSSSPRLQRKVLPPQESYLQRLSVSSTTSLWQDIPKVRESTMLLSMTREEQKLQEAKFELIASEASYLRSLNIAVDHFQHSQELQAVLTNQDRQWLFSRLQDVRDVSASFLFDLEEKLEENMFSFNVCDVALRHASEFRRVYLPYVTNQTYQEQTFQRLLNGVPAFQQVLEKLESDPVCQRLSLKSFLILPFQRITRLKLLLQNILKRTQPGAEEEVQATQAYDALEKLIKDCNQNVQRMKSTEQLIYLSQNMEFECKIFPLISQSRRLVKCGELTALEYNLNLKWKLTTRSIYLHLFNDCLLLSRPKENGRFIVFDYAASSDVRGEKCEMKLHGANKNVFRLFLLQNSQGKKVEFLFRTETQSEKLRWISAFMPQQTEHDLLDDSDVPQVQCVKSYKARENDELALEKADIIMVLQQSTDGWIEGVKLSDGEKGWFPSDQVEFISSKQVRQMNLKEEQRVKNAKQQVFHRK
ncbi:hypothetical protein JD844_027401 [Phrynosoma platyrhinos]|uniref:Rho guanine nucleotide exchange factor 5 n=1 Tax=Phrynosoma platyrhinos TaxID=52577 RepID=A0ABQ7SG87_PHRPL|nr:hypothetical protein JD844_027401 [Phrynosoma platyrhinos]